MSVCVIYTIYEGDPFTAMNWETIWHCFRSASMASVRLFCAGNTS